MPTFDTLDEALESGRATDRTYQCLLCEETFESAAKQRSTSCPCCGHSAVGPPLEGSR